MPDPLISPYNFVPLGKSAPERSAPLHWHRLDEKSISGSLECQLVALTPLFSADHQKAKPVSATDKRKIFPFLRNSDQQPLLQGTTIRGMVRSVFEAAFASCLPLTDETGISKKAGLDVVYKVSIPPGYLHADCMSPDQLCPACRLFGVIQGEAVHVQSRVVFTDGILLSGSKLQQETVYLKELSSPKPHHYPIYSESGVEGGQIRGRKFYYHHAEPSASATQDPTSADWSPRATALCEYAAPDTRFHFTVRLQNLSEEEFRDLVGCLLLDKQHAHKIGMAKPLGFGSCRIEIQGASSTVHRGADRYRSLGKFGTKFEYKEWCPKPEPLEKLLRLDLHTKETIGYLPFRGYVGKSIDANGKYVPMVARTAKATEPESTRSVPSPPGEFSLRSALGMPAENEPLTPKIKPLRRGEKIWATVLKAEPGNRFTLMAELRGQDDIPHNGGVQWKEGERVRVRVVDLDARGRITKVAPA
ncbi:MAG TPA: RAMP superfamily CRISPR-associated protein [Thermoanaerobaculia bacterium]|nr:RAMP superfamily CRISPR-associated protein [Thermoanaerobaculia bacterium]